MYTADINSGEKKMAEQVFNLLNSINAVSYKVSTSGPVFFPASVVHCVQTFSFDFRKYIRRYTSPNENFEYGYPHSNALLQFHLELERCKPHKATRHPTKCTAINGFKQFLTIYAGYTIKIFWHYPTRLRVMKSSALEWPFICLWARIKLCYYYYRTYTRRPEVFWTSWRHRSFRLLYHKCRPFRLTRRINSRELLI